MRSNSSPTRLILSGFAIRFGGSAEVDVPSWFMDDRVRDGVRMPARAWIGILAGLMAADPPTEAGSICTPTLILWGAKDELLPRGEQDALADAIQGLD